MVKNRRDIASSAPPLVQVCEVGRYLRTASYVPYHILATDRTKVLTVGFCVFGPLTNLLVSEQYPNFNMYCIESFISSD